MRLLTHFFYVLFLLSLTSCTVSSSIAKEKDTPDFSELIITTSDTDVLLFAQLKNSFTEEMIQGVKSGIPIQFSFKVELYKVRKNWFNKKTRVIHFKHIMTYNTLKDSYQVELQEVNHRIYSFSSLIEGQKSMNEVNGLKVSPLANLIEDANYLLRVKAEFSEEVPSTGFHRLTAFFGLLDSQTEWHDIAFKY